MNVCVCVFLSWSFKKSLDQRYLIEMQHKPVQFNSVQSLSHVLLFETAAQQASLSITNSQSLLKLMSIELVMPSNHLILCHPLFLLPSVVPNIRVFPKESHQVKLQSTGASASVSFFPMNIQGLFSLGSTGLISLLSKGLSRSPAPEFKSIDFPVFSLLYGPTLTSIHDSWKNHSFDYT